jgi:hypothetical protein
MFLRAGEFIRNQEVFSLQLATHEATRVDLRTKNSPTCNEVAAILLDDNVGAERDIICTNYSELAIRTRRAIH